MLIGTSGSGGMVDHAASMIGGAEIKGMKQTMKIVSANLRIELVQVECLELLDLCSKGQRFEGGPWDSWLYSRSAGIDVLVPGRLGYCTCQSRCQSCGKSTMVHGCSGRVGRRGRERSLDGFVESALVGVVLIECCDESHRIRSRKRTVGRSGDGSFGVHGGS